MFGAATLMHALVVGVGRCRRETGLLKVLGFVRRQAAFAVSWQTTTVAAVGLVVVRGMVALAAATLAVANLIATGPAIAAARTRPAALLRAE